MSTFFENKDRRVIPNFRPLNRTIELGELDSIKKGNSSFSPGEIEKYKIDFLDHQETAYAGDLLSAAIVNNINSDEIVIKAANFILDHEAQASRPQIFLARKLLNPQTSIQSSARFAKLDEMIECSKDFNREKIRKVKAHLKVLESNPFGYVELARLYSNIGLEEQSKKYIRIAKKLAPDNRYVIRSYSRVFAHFNEIDEAHDVLRKNPVVKQDPWLIASEIALASLRKKESNFIKHGREIVKSDKFTWSSISELASSIGTLELLDGNLSKSRDFFRKSLLKPNDNALAQFEWANNKVALFNNNLQEYETPYNFEALTLESYNNKNWSGTLDHAEQWLIDTPFAKRPIMYGHHAASFYLEDYESAIKFCQVGLIANPKDPMIINNLSYSLAMAGKASDAEGIISGITIADTIDDHVRICLLATKGLIHYRLREFEAGRKYYEQAIQEAVNCKLRDYYVMALLHLLREELGARPSTANSLFEHVMELPDQNNEEIKLMKQRVLKIKQAKIHA